jgi:putative DNA primase/helicase
MGSTSGVNVVVNPSQNSYCWMHNNINAGGDAWVWLAHECGAAPWEASGEGLLRDPVIKARTIEYAISKGLVKKEDFSEKTLQVKLRLEDVAVDVGEDDPKWKFSPTLAASSILKTMKLAMEKGCDKIYYFNGQIFVPDGERVINNMLVAAGGDLASIKNKKETVTILHDKLLDFPVIFDPDPYLLGVQNGLVDLRTGEFRAYRPEDLMTDQIPVSYDADAGCPNFIQFIMDIAPNQTDQAMLVDWYAIHAIKIMFPYVLFLNGLGRNGKGIYDRILRRFFGDAAFSSMPIEETDIKNNRFAGIGLYKKRGQIVSEAGEENKKKKRTISTNYLKMVTGDGIIDTDQKNKDRKQFKPYCEATIETNDMPLINDTSKGWIERFCKADLPYQYVDDPDPINHPMERKKDPDLFDKLTTEAELSGILNLIIERTIVISKTKKITKRPGEEMFAEYQQQSNSVTTFIEKFCDFQEMGDSRLNIFYDEIYKAYETWCDLLVCDKVDSRRFGASIKKLCNGREAERVHVLSDDGRDLKKRIYRGLVFDVNRYQALLDHQRTIKGPLKPITSPLGPLKHDILSHVENVKENSIERNFVKNHENGPDSDCENRIGLDIGFNGPKSDGNGPDIDLFEVVFKTDYSTDIDGKMQNVKQGETLKVSASRAQAWQKRGVVEIRRPT